MVRLPVGWHLLLNGPVALDNEMHRHLGVVIAQIAGRIALGQRAGRIVQDDDFGRDLITDPARRAELDADKLVIVDLHRGPSLSKRPYAVALNVALVAAVT